ncbi:ImmA/IrrE family metallo-endopeptidase [Mariniphaga sediminis]|uniref:ImmA/IrrE family metallo-endopeptidase n=1 Tax=Mariniphaga sediminis TaxID=1628158 RepID=A0A399CY89_9BACT|nr:ImmA/IrrE family metallo-endopeptidase [Mariniphaga sediminis]RIH63442.1 ImmA/IrrE family metallo-endopeptidase [Mariniphaga sediminis]
MSTKKNILKRGFKAEAERISEQLRIELNVPIYDELCAFKLAKYLGVEIFIPRELGCSGHEEKKLLLESGWSAFTSNKEGQYFIIHNNSHSPKRQQSNLMHELAHIIRKHEISEEIKNLPYFMRYYNPEQEAEAEYLGAALQLPRKGLLYHLKYGKSTHEIADHFRASYKMTNFRINNSGLKKQISYWK